MTKVLPESNLGDAIVEAVRSPLVVLDGRLRVNRANRAFYGLFRESPESTEDRLVYELGEGHWDIPELRRLLEEILPRHTEFDDYEVTQEFPAIGRRTLLLNARRIPAGPDHGPLILLAMEDETERRVAEARVQRYTDELERSNRALEEFAAVASHDLQEPLRKILMFGDRLRRSLPGALPEKAEDSLARMLNAAQRMQELIDGLLRYSRVTTRALPFERVDLSVVVDAVLGDLEGAADRTGASVTRDDLPTVEADPLQMRQLFQNLLTNALKFRRSDVAPRVHVGRRSLGDGAREEITVVDNGIGLEPQHAERIFGVFQRLHGHDEFEGSGIGLAICRRIVERHHGTIRAAPHPGGGAVFEVVLPTRNTQGAAP